MRLFSSTNKLMVVGDTRASADVKMTIFEVKDRELEEIETIEIRQPKRWFPGTLVAEDATQDLSRVMFKYERDPPMGSSLYLFDVRFRKMKRLGGLKSFNLFSSCDPIEAKLKEED